MDTRGHRPIIEHGRFKQLPVHSYLTYYVRLAPLAFSILIAVLGIHAAVVVVGVVERGRTLAAVDYTTAVVTMFVFTFAVHAVFVAAYELSDPQRHITDPAVLQPFRTMQASLWRSGLELGMLTVFLVLVAAIASVFVFVLEVL
ncbi:MAG: hypothetical protein OXK76_12565 [Gammaproteobacteria bacterium]|nr:hypothetical protein [Gammaproteobacteria bacterium]